MTDAETRRVQLDLLERWGGRSGALGRDQQLASLRMRSDRSWAAHFARAVSTEPVVSRRAKKKTPAAKFEDVAKAESVAQNQATRAHSEVHEASAKAIAREEAVQQGDGCRRVGRVVSWAMATAGTPRFRCTAKMDIMRESKENTIP